MLQNAPNCTIQKFFGGSMPRTPLAKAWLRHASQLSTQKSWPPLANPAYAHALLLKNLFEEMHS